MERIRVSCMRRIGSFMQQRARFSASSNCKPSRSLTTAEYSGWRGRGSSWSRLAAPSGVSLLAAITYSFFPFDDDVAAESAPLLRAARWNDVDAARRLLESGVDVNGRSSRPAAPRQHARSQAAQDEASCGWTALHVAAYHGHVEMVRLLLESGADVNAADVNETQHVFGGDFFFSGADAVFDRQRDFDQRLRVGQNFGGCTALHYAALGQRRCEPVVEALLAAGADPSLRNQIGHLPVDYVRDVKLAKFIEEAADKYGKLRKEHEVQQRLNHPLEQHIRERLVGQEGAIDAVAAAVRRKLNGWADDDHPLVFLFLGSSGIGKTELAKQVADYLHPANKKAFIRIDMSEYQQKHEVAKFIGSPPGYVGHEDGGQLTSKLKNAKDAVVLFDEVEKAHPDILTVLLQLFDEGRLTDGKGATIDCPEAIFIMTSNLASEKIADHAVQLRHEAAQLARNKHDGTVDDLTITEKVTISNKFKEETVRPILKRHFRRDEFLGRINEMVYFLPFSQAELAELVRRELNVWRQRAAKKHHLTIHWTDDLIDQLAAGYNVRYGARSIKHEVERRVVNLLAAAHERGDIKAGASVQIVVEGGAVAVKVVDAGAPDTPRRSIVSSLFGSA